MSWRWGGRDKETGKGEEREEEEKNRCQKSPAINIQAEDLRGGKRTDKRSGDALDVAGVHA